jgi:hypothetical protein
MKIGFCFLLILFFNSLIHGQETYTIVDNLDKRKIVDSLTFIGTTKPDFRGGLGGTIYATGEVSIADGLYSKIEIYEKGMKTICSADTLKEIIISHEKRQFVYKSVLNVKLSEEVNFKNAIFLFRLVDGDVELFQFEGPKFSGFLAKEKNQFTFFDYESFNKTCNDFFKDKPQIWPILSKMEKNDELTINSLINYIQYTNHPIEFKKGKDDYSELHTMIEDFIKVIKSTNEEELKDYCNKIFFDQKSSDYFEAFNQCHYGMPAESIEEYESFNNQYIQRVINFKRALERDNKASKIELIEVSPSESLTLSESLDISVQNGYFKVKLGDEENEIRDLSLGKVLNIKGILKTVSLPRL